MPQRRGTRCSTYSSSSQARVCRRIEARGVVSSRPRTSAGPPKQRSPERRRSPSTYARPPGGGQPGARRSRRNGSAARTQLPRATAVRRWSHRSARYSGQRARSETPERSVLRRARGTPPPPRRRASLRTGAGWKNAEKLRTSAARGMWGSNPRAPSEHVAAVSTSTGRARSGWLGLPSASCVRGLTAKCKRQSSACDDEADGSLPAGYRLLKSTRARMVRASYLEPSA
jgi:hypothetical protein